MENNRRYHKMKKGITIAVTLLLALAMCVGLYGCGGSK